MDLQKIIERAKEIKKLYEEADKNRDITWSRDDYVKAFVGDVGALVKLTMAKDGLRDIEDIDNRLAHEFGDILWSVVVLADMYGVNIEKSFMETVNELEERANKGVLAKTQARSGTFDK